MLWKKTNKRSKSRISKYFPEIFQKNSKKNVDFYYRIHYTVITWSKMDEKWCKMEQEVR